MVHQDDMTFESEEADQFGHKKLGGFGDQVSDLIKRNSIKYNNGKQINVVNQRLGYLVRSGDPDALDSIVPMAFGNLALDLILEGRSGLLVAVRNGVYSPVPIELVVGTKKVVDVDLYYETHRMRPKYDTFRSQPLFIMTSGS
jgi:6-phosphofructokinase 1